MRGFLRNYFKIIIVPLVVLIIGTGIYFIIKHNQKYGLTQEEKTVQNYSTQTGKNKFDLTGQVINFSEDYKTVTIKIENAGKTINKEQNQEIKLDITGYASVFDQSGQSIQISEIKTQEKVNIKGSFSGKNYTAEYIARL